MRVLCTAVLLLTLSGLTSCKRDEQIGIPFPRYPDSSYTPVSKRTVDGAELLVARVLARDAYQTVKEWYDTKLGRQWKRQHSDMGWTRFYTNNVKGVVPGRANFAYPKDAAVEAKIIVIVKANPTVIWMGHSVPPQ